MDVPDLAGIADWIFAERTEEDFCQFISHAPLSPIDPTGWWIDLTWRPEFERWFKEKKSKTELTTAVLKKDPKPHKRFKECFLSDKIRQDTNLQANYLFKSYVQYKNKQFTHLLPVGFMCPLSFARIQLAKDKWIVCFGIECSFENKDFLENLHPVLFCLIKKHSF